LCTAITFTASNHYFGRNLDFENDFGEAVVITPRNYPFAFRKKGIIKSHFAMIGMAVVDNNYPLYFDGMNEKGLSMAGLYFPGNARYLSENKGMNNIAPFEFIRWIFGTCQNLSQVKLRLNNLNLMDTPYSKQYPLSPLHWIIANKEASIVVEPMADGIKVHDNPVGVLTNNPPFDFHMHNLTGYLNLTREEPVNRFSPKCELSPYSRGMGAIGLPGDLSSASRFVRAAFVKMNSVCENTDEAGISQFFHILGSVAQQEGCARVGEGFEKTIYTSCCNTDTGIYYYTTYNNTRITGISMYNSNLDGRSLCVFPLRNVPDIKMDN
jgi:choloylglycine hydrolase